jgi:TonB family protein
MRPSIPVVIAFLWAGAAAQQSPAPAGPYHVGGGVTPPTVIERQEPGYTEQARVAKLQGSVSISIVVGEDGRPRNLRVLKPLGLGLDEAALATVEHWRFQPGTLNGRPVAVMATVDVSFRLLTDPQQWRLARVSFRVPEGATPPAVTQAPYPAALAGASSGAVAVEFDVDEQGRPSNIKVDSSSDPALEDEVIALIREWRFEAAMKNGIPVPAYVMMDFLRGNGHLPANPPTKKN